MLAGSTPESYYSFVKAHPQVMLSIFKAFDKNEESLEAAKLMLILIERVAGCTEAFSNKEQTLVILNLLRF